MKSDINWDNYYDGYAPFEKADVPEDAILHINYETEDLCFIDSINYDGPKTNATVKQIMYYLCVVQRDDKFLYDENAVVILLDYSKQIVDKWKNGTVLYCHGEKRYHTAGDKKNLSLIDKKLFCSGSSGEVRVYAFWKDESKNYNFVNGILILNEEPHQIIDSNGFRWVFQLAFTSKTYFSMPEKYSFNIDVSRVGKDVLQKDQRKDEMELINFNNTGRFDLSGDKPTYKGVPQKKSTALQKTESFERKRKTSENALRIADFKCECDANHFTFMRKSQNIPYTEAHHLVPLSYSELFDYSLDIEENIVSLCSHCHNQIHYGRDSAIIIKKLFADRKESLKKAGINLSEAELLSMY